MRTQQEILDRIESRKSQDILSFEWPLYVDLLTFENAKKYLKNGVTMEEWTQKTEEEIKAEAIEYMKFAWDKANNSRGISAGRSISHYIAWMWMLGHDNTERWEDYEYYGKPQLFEICELLGLDPLSME